MNDLPQEVIDKLPKDLIFLGYRGSDSHGLKLPSDDPHSTDDTDLMGVYIEDDSHYLGFGGKDTKEFWVGEYDIVLYEIRKFFRLLLKQNPNVMGLLWLANKHILHPHSGQVGYWTWNQILANRHLFVSRAAYHSFAGYANGQLHRMTRQTKQTPEVKKELELIDQELKWREKFTGKKGQQPYLHGKFMGWSTMKLRTRRNDLKGQRGYMGEKRKHLVEKYGYDCKNAAHLIRLLRMAVEYLEDGQLYVNRTNIDREDLLEIKTGQWSLERVEKESEEWFERARLAYESSPLDDKPDRQGAEELLMKILRRVLRNRSTERKMNKLMNGRWRG